MDIIAGVSKGYSVTSKKEHNNSINSREASRVATQNESGAYYDLLDNFDTAVMKINNQAEEGEEPKRLQENCLKLLPAFIALCGGNVVQPKKKPKPKTVLQVNLRTVNGWGVCPKCGKKCLKVNDDTILVNYPMFCKVCRRDYVVTWRKES